MAASQATSSEKTALLGQTVILYGNYENVFIVTLQHNEIFNCKYGSFPHYTIINEPFGSQIFNNRSDSYVYLLEPTPPLLTAALQHRTQIIYDADIAAILVGLDVREGVVVCEAGTGSGSLSCAFSAAVGESGRLLTFEFNEERKLAIDQMFKSLNLTNVSTEHRDVIENGFPEDIKADCLFLDLPSPWLCVGHAAKVLKAGGSVCLFSPCIEQVTKNCEALRRGGFHDAKTYEVLIKPWGLRQVFDRKRLRSDEADTANKGEATEKKKFISFQLPMRSHTSYLTFARKALDDEHLQPKAVVSVEAVLKAKRDHEAA
jgi:tRNA (adenine57-N1/adenine58-N1)-methyltransferase